MRTALLKKFASAVRRAASVILLEFHRQRTRFVTIRVGRHRRVVTSASWLAAVAAKVARKHLLIVFQESGNDNER